MKSKYLVLAASFALSHTAAFAQTTTTTIDPANTAGSSVAASSAPAAAEAYVHPEIKYISILRGPGLDFSGAQQNTFNGTPQMNYEQRVKFLAGLGKNFEAGVEARVNTNFGQGKATNFTSGNWRLTANFKNVYKDDIFNLTLNPRVFLPTSNAQRNNKTSWGPDLIADLAIAPKNTRFSFDLGAEYIQLFHGDGAVGKDYTNALTAEFAPWIELDYAVTPKTQLMISYWPVLDAFAQRSSPMSTSSNEIDVGAYYEFVKGWQVNPYVAAEMNGVADNQLKNMQLNLIIVGQIL